MMIFSRIESWFARCVLLTAAVYFLFGSSFAALGQGASGTNSPQQLVLVGLRSFAAQGQFRAVKIDSSGNLFLLLNQGDGVRLLKTDSAGNSLLAQAHLGAAGDAGVGLALDPTGNVYITGTSTSSSFPSTAGAAFPTRSGRTVNSFVARFDSALRPVFVTFTGGSRISAAGVAASADAVFVTGITYSADLPVTPNGVQQEPAPGSTQGALLSGFRATAARWSMRPTFPVRKAARPRPRSPPTPATTPTSQARPQRRASPTVAALVPEIVGNPSGFLSKLDPLGDGYSFSTFVPGAGLTSVALDGSGQTLLASGTVSLGQFPVDTVLTPLVPSSYQVLVKLPLDGSRVLSSILIAPGTESFVAPAPNGATWVTGSLSAPLLPIAPLSGVGAGFAVRVDGQNRIDQTARFGGLPANNPSFASLRVNLPGIAVDATGELVVAGSVEPTASAALLGTQTYDLPLRNAPTGALPSSLGEAKLPPGSCNGSLCAGSAAYLARLSPNSAAPALSFSTDDAPRVILRNLGSAAATGLSIAASSSTFATDCGFTLQPGGECNILLDGGGGIAGSFSADTANRATETAPYAAFHAAANSVVFSPRELDFGIGSGSSGPASRTINVTNLGGSSQSFSSLLDSSSPGASPFTQTATDCAPGTAGNTFVLGANQTCHITLGFSAAAAGSATGDGFLEANWLIADRDLLLTAATEVGALGVSSVEIDFGTQLAGELRLPRFLYLSNNSSASVAHTQVELPISSPFTVTDECPSTLQPHNVCRIRIDYLAAQQISTDTTTLTLDEGLSVLVTGQTLPPAFVSGLSANPNLSVSPGSVSFPGSTVVTGISSTSETISVTNKGLAAFSLSLGVSGDFSPSGNCGTSLPGGQSCQVVLSFHPSQPGTRQGLLSVIGGSGTAPVDVSLSGNASAIIPVANGIIDFGSVAIGTPVTRFFKVAQPFSDLSVSASGPYLVTLVEDVGFGPGQPPASSFVPSLSAACHTCYVGVLFQPSSVGIGAGVLSLQSTAGGSASTVDLTGTGFAATGLVLTPGAEQFGTLPQHSVSDAHWFTLTNLSADQSVANVGSPVVTGDFILSSAVTGAAPCGGLLAYTASCSVGIAFAPSAAGGRSGQLTLLLSGSASVPPSVQAALSGTGGNDPGIALDPTTLTFNNVPGLPARQRSISVTNTSGTGVQVGSPATTTAAFTATSHCAALVPSASCTITVSFQPGSAEAVDTLLIPVTSPAGGNTATYAVPLTGAYTLANAGLEIVRARRSMAPCRPFRKEQHASSR